MKVLAEGGVLEALEGRGVAVADRDRSMPRWSGGAHSSTSRALAATAAAARASGRLIGTNEDPTHPTPAGLVPGSGALLAAVATASGVDSGDRRQAARADGEAHPPAVRVRLQGTGPVVMVGDQPRTDGRLAARLGIPFALVDSGVTPAGADGLARCRWPCGPPDFVALVAAPA